MTSSRWPHAPRGRRAEAYAADVTAAADPRALLGRWRFERVVDDRRARDVVHVRGTTTLTEEGVGVRWAEEGVLRRGDLELPVSRVLHLVPGEAGWEVTFEDGREFHPWAPGDEVVHLCGADTYRGRVQVEPGEGDGEASAWSVVWQVAGPAKDYEMVTRLRRE